MKLAIFEHNQCPSESMNFYSQYPVKIVTSLWCQLVLDEIPHPKMEENIEVNDQENEERRSIQGILAWNED